jgi:hypothetical protein
MGQRGQAQKQDRARHGPHVRRRAQDSLGCCLSAQPRTQQAPGRRGSSQLQPPRTPVRLNARSVPRWRGRPSKSQVSFLGHRDAYTTSLRQPGLGAGAAAMSAPAMGPVLASARGPGVAGPKGLARGSRLRHAQPLAGGPQPRRRTWEAVSSVRGVARDACQVRSLLAAGAQRRRSSRVVTCASSAAAPGAAVPAPQAATGAAYTPQVRQLVGCGPWEVGGSL